MTKNESAGCRRILAGLGQGRQIALAKRLGVPKALIGGRRLIPAGGVRVMRRALDFSKIDAACLAVQKSGRRLLSTPRKLRQRLLGVKADCGQGP
jgi:hypothetical protein